MEKGNLVKCKGIIYPHVKNMIYKISEISANRKYAILNTSRNSVNLEDFEIYNFDKNKLLEPIDNFTLCPYCFSKSGYYKDFEVSGVIRDNTTFGGVKENTGMYDSLRHIPTTNYYRCRDCNEYISSVKNTEN